jgi:ssDNA-binding Zn-finger/Zn-ribbon topoisomerase 1
MKECPRCNDIKPLEDYFDEKLITGYGRFCNDCKGTSNKAKSKAKEQSLAQAQERMRAMVGVEPKNCPSCNSAMILRIRKRDGNKFFGCSRFPRCKGTRQLG